MMPTMRGEAENSITIISVQRIPTGNSDLPGAPDPAGDVERITREQVMKMLQTPTILIKLAQVLNLPAEKIAELFKETFWQEISPGEMNRLLPSSLEKSSSPKASSL